MLNKYLYEMDGFLSKNRFKSTQEPNLLQESESKESVERIGETLFTIFASLA